MKKMVKRADRMRSLNNFLESVLDTEEMIAEIECIFAEIESALSDTAEIVRPFVRIAEKYMRKVQNVSFNIRVPAGTFARPVACPQCYSHAFYRRRR